MDGSHRTLARLVTAVAIALAAASIGPGQVLADTERGHNGLVGAHSLTDTNVTTGARCNYATGDGREGAATVRVRPPDVFARNRTGGIDSQIVGWKVNVQQSENFTDWYTDYNSPTSRAQATDASHASFVGKTVNVPFNLFVRIRVVMYWYRPGAPTVQEGRAIHAVDHYIRYLDGTFEDKVTGYCPADLPV